MLNILVIALLISLNIFGSDELLVAAKKGDIVKIAACLERGDNIEYSNNVGYTPLLIAIRNGHYKVVKFLLSKGADVHKKSCYGLDVYQVDKFSSKKKLANITKALILAGAVYSPHHDLVQKRIQTDPDKFLATHMRTLIGLNNLDFKNILLEAAGFWADKDDLDKTRQVLLLNEDMNLVSDYYMANFLGCVLSRKWT